MGLVWRSFKKFLTHRCERCEHRCCAPLSGRGGGGEGLLWPPFADFRCSMQLYDPIRSESGLSWLAGTSQNRLLGAQALGGRAAKSIRLRTDGQLEAGEKRGRRAQALSTVGICEIKTLAGRKAWHMAWVGAGGCMAAARRA